MAEYLTSDDLVGRLTQVGMLYVADRNKDGVVDATEQTLYVTPAIVYAGNIVDGYIANQLVPATARGTSNPWLKDRAIDIAAYQACLVGGKDVPQSVKDAFTFTLKLLEGVKSDNDRIPGYPYPGPINTWYVNHAPKVANLVRHQRPATMRGRWPY